MVEIIKHSLGVCGEHWHPNLFTLLMSGLGLSPAFYYIKYKVKEYGHKRS
jgi:hypothetical protein